jgi:hypothetical protein
VAGNAGLLHRNIQSSKIIYAALLLLMLEAANTDLVSPQPEAQHRKNLQLSTSRRPITPSLHRWIQRIDAQHPFILSWHVGTICIQRACKDVVHAEAEASAGRAANVGKRRPGAQGTEAMSKILALKWENCSSACHRALAELCCVDRLNPPPRKPTSAQIWLMSPL